MDTIYYFICFLSGWCGTRWPGWYYPRKKIGPPDPGPVFGVMPEPWIPALIAAASGLGGGLLIAQLAPNEVSLVTVSIGAFVFGRIGSDLYNIGISIARN